MDFKQMLYLWFVMGFVIGILLGYVVFHIYIQKYTNTCVRAYEDCRFKYNGIVNSLNVKPTPEYPFNQDFIVPKINLTDIPK